MFGLNVARAGERRREFVSGRTEDGDRRVSSRKTETGETETGETETGETETGETETGEPAAERRRQERRRDGDRRDGDRRASSRKTETEAELAAERWPTASARTVASSGPGTIDILLYITLCQGPRSPRMRSDTLCVVTHFSLHGVTAQRSTQCSA